jgi:DNA-binding transcriptional LysR family regulator
MDFNQVRYFLALADTLNFTRAAEQCFVSQPALTQAIKRLEVELGGDLVDRKASHIEMTSLGRSLRTHFQLIDRTKNLVRTTANAVVNGEIAELNIGLMCTIGPRLISSMLDEFQKLFPTISLVLHDVTPSKIPDLVLSGAIDGAFCAHQGPPNSKIDYIKLFEEPMVVAFPKDHVFTDSSAISIKEVTKHRYIDRLHCEFRSQLINYVEDNEIELDIAFRSQREDWIQELIHQGVGVAVLPKNSLLSQHLDFRSISDDGFIRSIELAVSNHEQKSPALKHLIHQVREYNWV